MKTKKDLPRQPGSDTREVIQQHTAMVVCAHYNTAAGGRQEGGQMSKKKLKLVLKN